MYEIRVLLFLSDLQKKKYKGSFISYVFYFLIRASVVRENVAGFKTSYSHEQSWIPVSSYVARTQLIFVYVELVFHEVGFGVSGKSLSLLSSLIKFVLAREF